jgi:hypothetical protein
MREEGVNLKLAYGYFRMIASSSIESKRAFSASSKVFTKLGPV